MFQNKKNVHNQKFPKSNDQNVEFSNQELSNSNFQIKSVQHKKIQSKANDQNVKFPTKSYKTIFFVKPKVFNIKLSKIKSAQN